MIVFRVVSKYPQCIAWFCHNTRVWLLWQTDGRTDRDWIHSCWWARVSLVEKIFGKD